MPENQSKGEAVGEIGTVYTTQDGMDEADPEKQDVGWQQVTATKRIAVRSYDIGMHQRWWVWREVRKEQL